MKLSISSLNKIFVIIWLVLIFFSGCAIQQKAAKKDSDTPTTKIQVAVFPVENLSGTFAPLKEIRESLVNTLESKGVRLVEQEKLEKFMAKYRVRYVGGLDASTAEAFKKDIGTDAVLITSVQLYSETDPPKVALTSRLVSTGDRVTILWMDGIGMAGDDSPGILGLGLIEDPQKLLNKALGYLSNSLIEYLSNEEGGRNVRSTKKKFQPKVYYRSPELAPGKKYRVVVLPIFNYSDRKNAGEILVLQLVRELIKLKHFEVIELGVVRQRLLNARIIMDEGPSRSDVDLVANYLDADLIFAGKVMTYQDYEGNWGVSKVDFFISAIDRKSRKIVWDSNSYNRGDDKVYLFDWGKVNTAYAMTSQMVKWIGDLVSEEK